MFLSKSGLKGALLGLRRSKNLTFVPQVWVYVFHEGGIFVRMPFVLHWGHIQPTFRTLATL